ncbi:hypothetical protein THASP1DRAFT_28018 [Thamnocephalis sphaerospora]|uniref:Uncharacterized protein n=1 Tax=Thamnocephalis sphaerospora TaxID=78915 RepID=A0A4V1IX85_9FUNG|nr:hypothetical protein THASP1DRAFT_28018 [Thamnocephalis sphaerospora]|eukprot:RKP10179.1 hypothetical protein THASP1DRAFT_28018 [Thamnocephalis sphaerospora]
MTSRSFGEDDFAVVAEFIDRAVAITQEVKKQTTGTKLVDFKATLGDDVAKWPELQKLRDDVAAFSRRFPAIGFDETQMRYHD